MPHWDVRDGLYPREWETVSHLVWLVELRKIGKSGSSSSGKCAGRACCRAGARWYIPRICRSFSSPSSCPPPINLMSSRTDSAS